MLEILVACLYLINKVFLSLEKKAGWLIGAIASALAILYFFSLDLYLLITLEAGFLGLLIYGWFSHSKNIGKDRYVYAFIAGIMGLQFFLSKSARWIELADVFLFMLAIYALAKHRWYIGWTSLFFGHLLMAYITYEKAQYFFMSMQLISAAVAIFAMGRRLSRGRGRGPNLDFAG